MAAVCGCAQRHYDFVTPNDGGLFRVCEQCGTAWAFTIPGWWRQVENNPPPDDLAANFDIPGPLERER